MAPTNVGRAQFVLHYLPAIGADPQQVLIDATMQPFQALLDVPADVPNQVAQIEVGIDGLDDDEREAYDKFLDENGIPEEFDKFTAGDFEKVVTYLFPNGD